MSYTSIETLRALLPERASTLTLEILVRRARRVLYLTPCSRGLYAEALPLALAAMPCRHREGGFCCTRAVGHDGPHAAHLSEREVSAVWVEA